MKTRCLLILVLVFAVSLATYARDNWRKLSENPEYLHRSIKHVTDVIVHDIYSPPVASRIYAYVTVAAYEAARPMDNRYRSLSGQLHGLDNLPRPIPGTEYSFSVAAVHALLTVARSMIISEDRIARFHGDILQDLKASGMPAQVYDNSIAFGKQIAEAIIAWSLLDNYKQTRSLPKYSVSTAASTWKPTPPSYMKAVEPHWDGMRTFLIDSAKQFRPPTATNFSTDSSSQFFREAKLVYEAGLKLTAAQIEVANFWDCNPFKMNINGHVMYATKKISPGGHWINITGLACRKAKADFARSAEAYACVSVLLADAFISCWDEKYRSNVIRPETYINQYIDQSWTPLLQTPPFPEYTSGHSVISAAGALMLTKLFGEDFFYADSTEVEFDIPVRQFSSFRRAAQEAAISRFYGGIHYMPSIINGVEEGEKIGQFYLSKLRTRE